MGYKYLVNILKNDWFKEPEQQLEEKREASTSANYGNLYVFKRGVCPMSTLISLFTSRDHTFLFVGVFFCFLIVEANDPIPHMSHLSNGCKDTFVLCDVLWDSLENVLHVG